MIGVETYYPKLNNNTRILENINGKNFLVLNVKNENIRFELNKDAINVLKLCNGVNSIEDILNIVKDYYPEMSEDDFERKIFSFFKEISKFTFLSIPKKQSKVDVDLNNCKHLVTPQHLSIELTDGCNLRCVFCYLGTRKKDRKFKFIEKDKLLDFLEICYIHGLSVVELTGGEPLLHPDFIEIFNYCAKKFDIVGVLTNGLLLKENKVKELSKYKDKIFVNISLDSYDEKMHDYLRGVNGAHKAAVNAIKLLSKYGIKSRAAMTVVPETVGQITETMKFAKEIGATYFNYNPVLPFGYGEELKGSKFDWDTLTEETRKYLYQTELNLFENYNDYIPYVDNIDEIKNCGAGFKSFSLDAHGELKLCAMGGRNESFGNVFNEDFERLFSKDVFKLLRDLHAPSKEICLDCEFANYCHKCVLRGMQKSQEKKEKCYWATKNKENLRKIFS